MRTPKKFVGLHSHTTFSPYDGLGYPAQHLEFVRENGMDGLGITEHGNFNSLAHAQLFIDDWKKKDPHLNLKYIPGIEAYFHPDLEQWQRDKVRDEEEQANAKLANKEAKKAKKKRDEEEPSVLMAKRDEDDEIVEIETANALTLENEDESKSTRVFKPVNRRHHLVLLPKDSEGLQQLFWLTSRSFIEGFFRFPRIDLKMMRECLKGGHVIASSACVAGFPAWSVFQLYKGLAFDEMTPDLLDDPEALSRAVNAVGNVYQMMTDVLGEGNYFLELQFNKLPAQDLANRAILEFAKRANVTQQLVVTADSHYYNPSVWRERELYKKLGFMNYTAYSPDMLPKSVEDLKCELYPKNASQIWDEYLRAKERRSFYKSDDDDIVCDAVERTWHIAHERIGKPEVDKTIKLPKKLVPEDETPISHLTQLCIAGLKERKLHRKKEYIERLKEELRVIEHHKMPEYFITLARIMELARKVVLLGAARGSGGGSLVNYLLHITDLDPLKWDLPFSRFMSMQRAEVPDIDSDVSDRDKVLDVMRKEFGEHNVVPISNYNTTKLKSLVKDLSKFYGVPFDEVNTALKTVEQDVRKATQSRTDDKNLFVLQYEPALKHSPTFKAFIDKHPEVGQSIQILFKQNRSLGRHAGGVLVCDDLPMKMPLITSKGEPQSPWVEGTNLKTLEKIGKFIKYDILGISTLRLIEETIRRILEGNGGVIELKIENETHRIAANSLVLLTSGERKRADQLDQDDDVVVPLDTE